MASRPVRCKIARDRVDGVDEASVAPPPDAATAALALTAWQMIAVLSMSLLWLGGEYGGDVAAASAAASETIREGLGRPELALTLLWTGPCRRHAHGARTYRARVSGSR